MKCHAKLFLKLPKELVPSHYDVLFLHAPTGYYCYYLQMVAVLYSLFAGHCQMRHWRHSSTVHRLPVRPALSTRALLVVPAVVPSPVPRPGPLHALLRSPLHAPPLVPVVGQEVEESPRRSSPRSNAALIPPSQLLLLAAILPQSTIPAIRRTGGRPRHSPH